MVVDLNVSIWVTLAYAFEIHTFFSWQVAFLSGRLKAELFDEPDEEHRGYDLQRVAQQKFSICSGFNTFVAWAMYAFNTAT